MSDAQEPKGTLLDTYIDIDDEGIYQLHCLFDGDFTARREKIFRSLVQSRNINSTDRVPQGDARVSKVSRAFKHYHRAYSDDKQEVPKGAIRLNTVAKTRADYVSIVQMSMLQWADKAEEDATMLAMLHDNIDLLRGQGVLVWSFADDDFTWSGIDFESINPTDDDIANAVVEDSYLPYTMDLTNQYEIRRAMIAQLMEDFPMLGPRIFRTMVQATDHMKALGEVKSEADLIALEDDDLGFHLTGTGSDVASRRKARAARKRGKSASADDANTDSGGKKKPGGKEGGGE